MPSWRFFASNRGFAQMITVLKLSMPAWKWKRRERTAPEAELIKNAASTIREAN
jgi:hypothetical protein